MASVTMLSVPRTSPGERDERHKVLGGKRGVATSRLGTVAIMLIREVGDRIVGQLRMSVALMVWLVKLTSSV
jgi:hypothetical protein